MKEGMMTPSGKIRRDARLRPGSFAVGCNYSSSHGSFFMWSDWRPDVVDGDLRELARAGIQIVRVMPLWSEFQPIHLLRGWAGIPREFRFGEEPLPADGAGRDGMSETMLDRFAAFTALCRKHGLRVVVSLLNGWTGRVFVPPALEGLNPLSDPRAMRWELRFIRRFVRRFREDEAILAWEPGNECNCLGEVSREQAWLWTAAMADAIRSADPSRPIFSGMHGLRCEADRPWTVADQAENVDFLTTHAYPPFTPYCDRDPIDTPSSILHATAEGCLYAGVGQKSCLAEELGSLGPMFGGDEQAAARLRASLFSLWAHDARALLYYCAYDYDRRRLSHAPYDWYSFEFQLGLFRKRGRPKTMVKAFREFRAFHDRFPVNPLPLREIDAVCILTEGQDMWSAAYGSFLLAVQAGLNIEFQQADQPIRPTQMYLLPSLAGSSSLSRRQWEGLLSRVRSGATLYLSLDDAILRSFDELTGLRLKTRERRRGPAEIRFAGAPGDTWRVESGFRLNLANARARVLAQEPDGNPAFARAKYGKGTVFFLAAPIELEVARRPGAVYGPDAAPYWRVYRHFAQRALARHAVRKDSPSVGLTEHRVSNTRRAIVAVNYAPEPLSETLRLGKGWRLEKSHYGAVTAEQAGALRCSLHANDAAVFSVRR